MLSATRLLNTQGKRLQHKIRGNKNTERAHLLRWFCFVLKAFIDGLLTKAMRVMARERGHEGVSLKLKVPKRANLGKMGGGRSVCRPSERVRQT